MSKKDKWIFGLCVISFVLSFVLGSYVPEDSKLLLTVVQVVSFAVFAAVLWNFTMGEARKVAQDRRNKLVQQFNDLDYIITTVGWNPHDELNSDDLACLRRLKLWRDEIGVQVFTGYKKTLEESEA